MTFLSKDQQKTLTGLNWDLVPNPNGAVWFESSFDKPSSSLNTLSDLLPLDTTAIGYRFLVVAYKEIEEEV